MPFSMNLLEAYDHFENLKSLLVTTIAQQVEFFFSVKPQLFKVAFKDTNINTG